MPTGNERITIDELKELRKKAADYNKLKAENEALKKELEQAKKK